MENVNRKEIEVCLLNNGFDRQEIRIYLKSIKEEAKAISTSQLFVNAGIRRFVKIDGQKIEV